MGPFAFAIAASYPEQPRNLGPIKPRRRFRSANLRRFGFAQLRAIASNLSDRMERPFCFDMSGMPGDTVGGDEAYARLNEVRSEIARRGHSISAQLRDEATAEAI